MAIRYFKCHTLPYPSYELVADSTVAGKADLAWVNGPPGAGTSGSTLVEYALVASTAATTVATAGYLDTSVSITGLTNNATYQFRLRRVNGIGSGEWTGFAQVRIAT